MQEELENWLGNQVLLPLQIETSVIFKAHETNSVHYAVVSSARQRTCTLSAIRGVHQLSSARMYMSAGRIYITPADIYIFVGVASHYKEADEHPDCRDSAIYKPVLSQSYMSTVFEVGRNYYRSTLM